MTAALKNVVNRQPRISRRKVRRGSQTRPGLAIKDKMANPTHKSMQEARHHTISLLLWKTLTIRSADGQDRTDTVL
jgi:hypothetical protein